MPEVVELIGFPELERWLTDAPATALPYCEQAMQLGLDALVGRLKAYPPETEANRPGRVDFHGRPMGYYERGQGWWSPVHSIEDLHGETLKSKGARVLGKRAAAKMGLVGYKLIRNSERLREHWYSKVMRSANGVEGVVGTAVSYAGKVEGFLSHDPRQEELPASRKWPSIETAIVESEGDFAAAFDEALAKLSADFKGA